MTPAQRKDLLGRIAAFREAESEASAEGWGMTDSDPMAEAFAIAEDLAVTLETILAAPTSTRAARKAATFTPIGFGYAVTDRTAGALARGVARKLPRAGYALRVALPCGALAWLARTPLQASPRGWTWYVDSKGGAT